MNRVECSRGRGPRVSSHRDGTVDRHGARRCGLCAQRRTGPEYPGRQDCVTIPQTSERVGDLALVEVSRRAAPLLLRARPPPPALLCCAGAVLSCAVLRCAALCSLVPGRPRDEQATPGRLMTTGTMMDSQKETRTRDFGFRGCGGVLLLDRWGAQSTHVVRGCFGPPPGIEAVEGGGLLRGGRRSAVHGQHGQVSSLLRTEAQRRARRGSHAPLLPCSRVQPVNWPQVPEDAGHGRCSAGAAQAQRSCSCSVLGRGTQNGDCLGL